MHKCEETRVQKLEREHKTLQKAVILGSVELRKEQSKLESLQQENAKLRESIPIQLLPAPEFDLSAINETVLEHLFRIKRALTASRTETCQLMKTNSLLKEEVQKNEAELKALTKRQHIQKTGSYFNIHQRKKATKPKLS